MSDRERGKYEEIINYEKDVIKKFAEKIKSHMMMYCQSRIEQQYCALEVIDYIGKLMGEKDFSIDVEKEIKEHDEKIRTDERAKVVDEIDGFCFDYNKTAKCFGECSRCPLGIFVEQMKGEQK